MLSFPHASTWTGARHSGLIFGRLFPSLSFAHLVRSSVRPSHRTSGSSPRATPAAAFFSPPANGGTGRARPPAGRKTDDDAEEREMMWVRPMRGKKEEEEEPLFRLLCILIRCGAAEVRGEEGETVLVWDSVLHMVVACCGRNHMIQLHSL